LDYIKNIITILTSILLASHVFEKLKLYNKGGSYLTFFIRKDELIQTANLVGHDIFSLKKNNSSNI